MQLLHHECSRGPAITFAGLISRVLHDSRLGLINLYCIVCKDPDIPKNQVSNNVTIWQTNFGSHDRPRYNEVRYNDVRYNEVRYNDVCYN